MRRFHKLIPIAVLFPLAMNVVNAPAASAAPSCTFTNGVLTINDDAATGQDRIDVWQDTDGQVWASTGPVATPASPGTFCSGTPIAATSVTSIAVTAGAAVDALAIWLSQTPAATIPSPPSPLGGPLADWGATTWSVDLGSTPGDGIVALDAGATAGLDLTAGDSGIDLNGDNQVDVTYSGVSVLEVVVAGAGSFTGSHISAAGNNATGGPATVHVVFLSVGKANDIFTGGAGDDLIGGGDGNDKIRGGGGNDKLLGGKGNDRIAGDAGNDKIIGGPGRDVCSGGPGKDKVVCEIGRGA